MIILNKTKKMNPRFKESRRLGLNVYRHPKAMKKATRGSARDDKKLSEYGMQLLEKQRLKAYYGVSEKQMVRYFNKSKNTDILTGTALVQQLETRLDNIVYNQEQKMIFQALLEEQQKQTIEHDELWNDLLK